MGLIKSLLRSAVVQKGFDYAKHNGIIDAIVTLMCVAGLYYGWGILTEYGVDQLAATSLIRTIMLVVLLLTILRVTTRAFDMLSGIDFRKWWAESNNSDKALYLSVRFAALAIALAIVLG